MIATYQWCSAENSREMRHCFKKHVLQSSQLEFFCEDYNERRHDHSHIGVARVAVRLEKVKEYPTYGYKPLVNITKFDRLCLFRLLL